MYILIPIRICWIRLIHYNRKNRCLLEKLDKDVVKKFLLETEKLNPRIDFLESQKCNFDVEIALDIFQSLKSCDGIILFSGDGDFEKVVQLARAEGKYVIVITLRKFLAGELIKSVALLCLFPMISQYATIQ